MWTCPQCGARLIHANLSHSCGRFDVGTFLAGRSAQGVTLFRRFEAMVRACGEITAAPAKTRVAFLAEVRFASVNAVRADAIDIHLVLPRRLSSPRFRRVEAIDRVFVHHMRLGDDADFDDELAGWVQAAHDEYGLRQWLKKEAPTAGSKRRGRSAGSPPAALGPAPERKVDESEVPRSAPDAILWLASRGAHAWLVRHHELVVEAAEAIVQGLGSLRIDFDVDHVLLGAALHDAGKIAHPEEMRAPGHAHEGSGEQMLLASGFAARVARACVTHAAWSEPRALLEDRLVALADKLWKGKRDAELEGALVEEISARTGRDRWEVFQAFDTLCETVAEEGPDRLRRSAV